MTNSYQSFFNDDPWGLIEEPCYPDGRRLYLNDDRFWVSVNDTGQVLFFVHDQGGETVKGLENLAGVEIEIGVHGNDAYRLTCTLVDSDTELREKFSIVAKDVAYHCSRFSGTQLFIEVQNRIKSWANFLKPDRSGLAHSEFVGLLGELYVLSELVMKSHAPSEAVRFWIGPEGKKQDITLNSIAIEVKASVSGDAQTIKISSLDQLERVTEKLYLLHIGLTPSDNENGLSLENLYRKCISEVAHDISAETLFLQKTSELYGKANNSQLNEKYSIASQTIFEVRDDFPCIRREMVSSAVARLKYEIYVTALREFEVTEDIREIIKNG